MANTELTRNTPRITAAFYARVMSQNAAMGALPTLRAATDPAVLGGAYYGPGGFLSTRGYPKLAHASGQSRDAAIQRRLWTVSEELTGVRSRSDPAPVCQQTPGSGHADASPQLPAGLPVGDAIGAVAVVVPRHHFPHHLGSVPRREPAAQGHLLRLWRPPLNPGEWLHGVCSGRRTRPNWRACCRRCVPDL